MIRDVKRYGENAKIEAIDIHVFSYYIYIYIEREIARYIDVYIYIHDRGRHPEGHQEARPLGGGLAELHHARDVWAREALYMIV